MTEKRTLTTWTECWEDRSISPGNPQAAEPEGCCVLLKRFRWRQRPGRRCKTSGTHFRQPIAGHRSFPKTLGDWVSSREPESSNARGADSGTSSSGVLPALILLLYDPPFLLCKPRHHVHMSHMLYLRALQEWDSLRYYEIVSLNLCIAKVLKFCRIMCEEESTAGSIGSQNTLRDARLTEHCP